MKLLMVGSAYLAFVSCCSGAIEGFQHVLVSPVMTSCLMLDSISSTSYPERASGISTLNHQGFVLQEHRMQLKDIFGRR
jgi:hypothetical protein